MNKFIFVSGGVCSSLGKGVAASSIGALLESRGLNVRMVKCDPYINVNAGTMSPFQHGEIYVTDDGAETDLDLGNYARFTKGRLSQANSITTGQVYESVIRKEREGQYQGRCVQVIPHITDEIKSRIIAVAKEENTTDVVIIEIGGTVGDIESIPFLEAARQMIHEYGRTNALSVHLTLIPEVAGGELKTKPTQHSVKSMQEMGIQPDILICRSPVMLDEPTSRKIAQFTNVDIDAVLTSPNIDTTIYQIPLVFSDQKLDQVLLRKMGVEIRHTDMSPWHSVMKLFSARKNLIRIGIVGNYMETHDTYTSLLEALFHASLECGVETELVKIDSSALETGDINAIFGDKAAGGSVDGILVSGGMVCNADMSEGGINSMVKAAAWARTNKKPYLGICLGMHAMIVDWARSALNWNDADSAEFSPNTKRAVVSSETIRLGAIESVNEDGTHIMAAYGEKKIIERHRHRYAFSNQYRDEMVKSGLKLAALTPNAETAGGTLVDCVEWPNEIHPWGVGVQFHPEFKSKPTAAAPLFKGFITAIKKKK
ncbi:MAG: CTP synthase [Treponema sp.]|nr:CTP synthase [Treponema sp.]